MFAGGEPRGLRGVELQHWPAAVLCIFQHAESSMDADTLLDSIESQSVVVNDKILATLESFLLDPKLSMEKRYRCVFTLKNLGGEASRTVLFKGTPRGFLVTPVIFMSY